MKKLLVGLMLLSFSFAVTIEYSANPAIRSAKGKTRSSYQSLQLELKAIEIATPNTTYTWYADNIAGYSTIRMTGLDTATGNATTISAQAIYSDGRVVSGSAEQVLSFVTPTATVVGAYYKFTYNSNNSVLLAPTANGITNKVTLNFLITD